MTSQLKAPFVCLICLSMSACAAFHGRPDNPPTLDAHRAALVQKYAKNDSWYNDYMAAINADQSDKAKQIRDQVLYDLILLVDHQYDDFEKSLYASSALLDTGTAVTSTAATSAATITRAPGTKSILAAVSTVVTGTGSAVNSNAFQSKTRAAIIAKMRSGRAEVLARLTTGITHSVSDYSLGQGLVDILSYYDAGTVVAALNSIGNDAGVQTKEAPDKARALFVR